MASTTAPQRIVDRYALFDVIATGGMASVHLGRLMGPVGFTRTVAIKRLHEQFARDPEFVAMFLDEARLVARIRHPNVVQTLDVVASAQELLLVMEYVLGESLAQLIKAARSAGQLIPIPIVVDIVTSLLNGLHAAHEATNEKGEPLNVVHRDVSPQNVLVGTDGVTRVLDFGIAQAIGYMPQHRSAKVKGKIRYMPLEQFSGEDVGRAADIYAASVVLWETLACSRLFGRGTDEEAMRRVLEGKVPAPSQVRPDIPKALDEIVLRGLKRDAAERYQTALAMADALEGVSQPVTRNTVSTWVLECAKEEIQRRQECLTRVESSVTPPPIVLPAVPSTAEPTQPDSSSGSVGPLAQSERPAAAPAFPVSSRRKRLILAAGAAALLALAAVTPSLFGGSPPEPDDEPKAATGHPRGVEPSAMDEAPALGIPAAAGVPPALPATSAEPAPPAEPSASPPAAPAPVPTDPAATGGKRVMPTNAPKMRAKPGSFDRIYRRD